MRGNCSVHMENGMTMHRADVSRISQGSSASSVGCSIVPRVPSRSVRPRLLLNISMVVSDCFMLGHMHCMRCHVYRLPDGAESEGASLW